MRSRLSALRESVTTGFWFLPTLGVVVAVLAALVLVEVDRALDDGLRRFTFGAGPDGAREVLSAITTSMITFTGLVFSITIVVLQLTSSQFSPRVLRTFLRDRVTQGSLSVFVATFVYAVMVLRTVDSDNSDDRFTPALATSVGVLLLLGSVGVFVGYIHHVATAIQVSSIIRAIARETRRTIDDVVPPDHADLPPPQDDGPVLVPPLVRRLQASRAGVVTGTDPQALVRLARAADVVLVVREPVGAYVPEGMALVDVHGVLGGGADLDERAVLRAVALRDERTTSQDVAFGLRQLVDIAEKALSPGINDPTTAVQALDQVHDLLRRVVARRMPDGVHRDDDGAVRVLVPPLRVDDLLSLALDEVEQYGADTQQVQQRLDRMLADLAVAARGEHRPAVEARQALRGPRARSERRSGGVEVVHRVAAEQAEARSRHGAGASPS